MAADPRADPPQVRLLDAHAAAPARAPAPRLVAEFPARRPDAVLTSSSGVFRLTSEYSPRGAQPPAIAGLTRFVREGRRHVVLRGVTGSGKTYTIANLIASAGRPTLVISPNKTLAAQLFSEFKAFFPSNAVEYFVSYYDYYQPEAYIPQSDTYIEKDALINDEIDRMRHSATKSLLERRAGLRPPPDPRPFSMADPRALLGHLPRRRVRAHVGPGGIPSAPYTMPIEPDDH